MEQLPLKVRFRSPWKLAVCCALLGAAAAAVVYGGSYFVMALANYFDGRYKHPAFYTRYPTALAYLLAYGKNGDFQSLPGYAIKLHVGIPLALACAMLVLAILLALLQGRLRLTVSETELTGRPLLRRTCRIRMEAVVSVVPALGGLRLRVGKKMLLFPLIRNREQVLQCIRRLCSNL